MKLRKVECLCLALGAASFATHAQAAPTKFATHQIVINGDINVDATALNESGSIVGTMFANITEHPIGFVMKGKAVGILPPPYDPNGGPYPQAIDKVGNIAGWAGRGTAENPSLFFWHAATKKYDASYELPINVIYGSALGHIVNAIGLGANGEVFYNFIYNFDASDTPEFGTPGHFTKVPLLSRFVRLNSINAAGEVAGIAFSSTGPGSVFMHDAHGYKLLAPAGAQKADGGFINASGAVAGSYAAKGASPLAPGMWHGFVYDAGQYVSFDMPETPSAISVTGFSDTGRVVGVYTSAANGRQHAFLYNGTTVSTFGAYDGAENVQVSVNSHATMLVARQFIDQKPNYESYKIVCSGAGC
jgi:probable HAF family extracellular repeat protein